MLGPKSHYCSSLRLEVYGNITVPSYVIDPNRTFSILDMTIRVFFYKELGILVSAEGFLTLPNFQYSEFHTSL